MDTWRGDSHFLLRFVPEQTITWNVRTSSMYCEKTLAESWKLSWLRHVTGNLALQETKASYRSLTMISFGHLWTVLVLLHLWTQEVVEASSLVLTNNGLRVGRGQTVYITENDLSFNIPHDKDSCRVEVVLNEPTTQRVGTLSPQGFDCHFLPEEVKFSHNGSPMLDKDHVMLMVYRFSEQETIVEGFKLEVKVTEPLASIAVVQNSLEVPEFYGISSNPLDKNILSFKPSSERSGLNCVVKTLVSELSLPGYGRVVLEEPKQESRIMLGSPGNPRARSYRQDRVQCSGNKVCHPGFKEMKQLKTSCADFLEMGIKYEHLSPPSPDVDYIPLQIEYSSQDSRKQLQSQNVWIPVNISGAVPNTPPRAAFMPSFILEIDQFILTPLTTATLDAEDDETPKNKLVLMITKAPPQGFITHLDDQTKPITSFTWQDLHDMKIAYQPPNTTHLERRNYEVEFQAIDGHFLTSPPIMVHFSIRTAETNAPRVSWNIGLNLLEGQSRPITWDVFQIVDVDNLQAVRLVTVDGLHHGRLMLRGSKAFTFTVQDIRDGTVHYHHDDSDTTKDYIVFRIFDGRHSIRHKFPINILPKDDSPPFLVNNIGLEVIEGGAIPIEKDILVASDLDSSDDHILYNITRPPKAGELVRRYSAESPGVPVETFLQRDLFHGVIYYRHFGGEIFQDSFEFVLSDSHEPPNYSERQTFVIHIASVKDQLPIEAVGTRRHMSVKENEISRITRQHLHFTDRESPDSQLVYTISRPCYSPGLQDAGKLIFLDTSSLLEKNPAIDSLSSFTQHAVNHMKVAYMPPIRDIGPDTLHVQFEFSVGDEHGGRLTGLIFNITVLPVDDKVPKIFAHPARTEEGASCLITGESLVISDEDTKSENLRIVLKSGPQHGNVELHGVPIIEGSAFSLEDLRTFKVRYQHDDSESLVDTIIFAVTDGINTAEGELKVQIFPVNDEPPELRSGLKSTLFCPEGSQIYITTENLYATDPDSDDTRLTYMIARIPLYGVIQREGVMVEKFAQLDVVRGLITYRHTGGEIGAHPQMDTVTLIVSDGESVSADTCCIEGPPPPPIPLHASLPVYDLNITLTPINNQLPVIIIGDVFVVEEGFSSRLSVNHVNASDVDTLADDLIFFMETQPEYGYLESTIPSPGSEKSTTETRIGSFSLRHVSSGYIRYVQSHHEHMEPTSDFFMISATDSIHKSMIVPFYIVIKPINDEEPRLHVRNITIMEGGSCEIGPATLSAEDLDIPPDILYFSIVTPPVHGILLHNLHAADISPYKQLDSNGIHREALMDAFTLDALKQGMTIVYTHDDTETRQDRFTVQLTDGKHTVQKTLQVHITPVNDEKPQLIRNGGLGVDAADNKVISCLVLEAEDKDSLRTAVYYVINNTPMFGELKKKVDSSWLTLYAGMNFTQEDIDMNEIWYFHTIILGCKGYDSFRFYVTDGEHNIVPQTFFISILNLEKGDIILLTSPVTLTEGDRVTLMTDVLMATDGTGKPEKLLYAVSVPPVHGQIEYINFPGVPISSFSQLDVAAQKVCYVHDNSREAGKDSFSFTVSNGLKAKDGSLEFIIKQTDRIPPTLLNNKGLQILEGEAIVITSDVLQITDPDSPLEKLIYTIAEYPKHGQLYLNGDVLQQNYFTQIDINNLYLSYQHHGGAGELDHFSFTATDGSNVGFLLNGQLKEDSAVFVIEENHVDKMPPKIVNKENPSTVESLKDGRSAIQITSQNLRASDTDDADEDLVYVILRAPHFGHLEKSKTGHYIGRTFTQREINHRAIRYIINPSFQVTSDSFEFEVSDSAGNKISPDALELNWSVIGLTESHYHICESTGTLSVKVTRSGSSKDPAFVGIKVQEITARLGQDFTHTSASLLQFDPGVSTKSWNIYVKNDGLEENDELLKVILSSPKNAVLGKSTEATIEIMDPRQGQCRNQDSTPGAILYHTIVRNSRGHQLRPDGGREGRLATSPKITQILLPNPHTSDRFRSSELPSHRPGAQRRFTGSGVLYEEATSHETQEISKRGDMWLSIDAEERPLQDSVVVDSGHQTSNATQQDKKPRICPAGWSLHQKYCYYLSAHQKATWEDAERRCAQTDGGHITSVHSEAVMRWLWKFADKKTFWIGLRLVGDPSSWRWTNGHPWTFSGFTKTEFPLGESAENCVLAGRRREWQLSGCSQRQRYICSFPL